MEVLEMLRHEVLTWGAPHHAEICLVPWGIIGILEARR